MNDMSKAMWAPVLEKAWAKVKGSYEIAGNGGLTANGMRAILGIPVVDTYVADASSANSIFDELTLADQANWPMGAGTSGEGNDQVQNQCGIAKSHAYTIITTFMMDGEKMIMMRNPWGSTHYSGPWSKNDGRWTSSKVAQVPFGIDPRTDHEIGVFTIPLSTFADRGIQCIENYSIGHMRSGEGYKFSWYDEDNVQNYRQSWSTRVGLGGGNDESEQEFKITVPQNDGDLYFTLETYYPGMVQQSCIGGSYGGYNIINFEVYNGRSRVMQSAYADQYAKVAHVKERDYRAGSTFTIKAQVKWYNNPFWEYTARVYSKQDLDVKNDRGQTNMVHFDGQSPSGFTSSNYNGWRADGGSVDVVENPLPIDVAAFVALMNDEFQATALARVGFQGLTLDETKDFLVFGYSHYGLSGLDCG